MFGVNIFNILPRQDITDEEEQPEKPKTTQKPEVKNPKKKLTKEDRDFDYVAKPGQEKKQKVEVEAEKPAVVLAPKKPDPPAAVEPLPVEEEKKPQKKKNAKAKLEAQQKEAEVEEQGDDNSIPLDAYLREKYGDDFKDSLEDEEVVKEVIIPEEYLKLGLKPSKQKERLEPKVIKKNKVVSA